MTRAVLIACLPWLALLAVSVFALFLLARISGAWPDFGRLRRLHADQAGAVETLSFVLTLPLFILVLMFIVQVSQLMIGQMVVEYAAIAAARAAVVWIPAYVTSAEGIEGWNCVARYDSDGPGNIDPPTPPTLPPFSGPQAGGKTHVLDHVGVKYGNIRMAAVLACLPIAPSHDYGFSVPPDASGTLLSLTRAYTAMTGGTVADTRLQTRLQNKLAYTLYQRDPSDPDPLNDTLTVDVQFYHSNEELPLAPPWDVHRNTLGLRPDLREFRVGNELGWQDPITVTVHYNLALLPGLGRLLAAGVSQIISRGNGLYTYPLTATATQGNEGEKPNYAGYYPINQY